MGCEEHTLQHQQQQQQLQQLPHFHQALQLRTIPANIQLQVRPNQECLNKTSTENIISVSSASASTKVIVEAAKSIPIEGQSDLQHMQQQHQHQAASLQEIKELDFSMF
jgi:hypothetical protein